MPQWPIYKYIVSLGLASVSMALINVPTSTQGLQIGFDSPSAYTNLPVASVESHRVDGSEKTVIFIPQIHRNPGDDISSKSNDVAEATQLEIYEIIRFLNESYGIDFVMVEGELYGKVPDEKINKASEQVEDKIALDSAITKLNTEMSSDYDLARFTNQIIKEKDKVISQTDRHLLLQGAPYKARAEGMRLTLWGAENPDTYKESAGHVTKYIYLLDRQKQLNSKSSGKLTSNPKENNSSILRLIAGFAGDRDSVANLTGLITSIKVKANVKGDLQLAQAADISLICLRDLGEDLQSPQNKSSLSRSNNPYADITDPRKIRELIDETETKIESIIIDRRNIETAQNFKNALDENDKDIGLLQFGAGHTEGLVRELIEQGLNVVVITPGQVASRSQSLAH